jgi:alpha-amylase
MEQGYWTVDPTELNPHFGTSNDLSALSSALHTRGMYLMVDIAINFGHTCLG